MIPLLFIPFTLDKQEEIAKILKNTGRVTINCNGKLIHVKELADKIVDLKLIVDLACNAKTIYIGNLFLKKIKDEKILCEILLKNCKGGCWWWWSKTPLKKYFGKIKDQRFLKKVIDTVDDRYVYYFGQRVVELLTDVDILIEISLTGKNKEVRKAAAKRIDELKEMSRNDKAVSLQKAAFHKKKRKRGN